MRWLSPTQCQLLLFPFMDSTPGSSSLCHSNCLALRSALSDMFVLVDKKLFYIYLFCVCACVSMCVHPYESNRNYKLLYLDAETKTWFQVLCREVSSPSSKVLVHF